MKNATQHLSSPVTDSIVLDNLHAINEKYDDIDRRLAALDTNVKSLQRDDTSNQSTQQLRDRYLKLFDADTEIINVEQPNTFVHLNSNEATIDDLSRYPIIQQLIQTKPPSNNNNKNKIDHQHQQPLQRAVDDKLAFYVTKFTPNTTTEMIVDYMRENGVADFESTKVSCLIPRNKDRSSLNFISFKIDTNADIARVITSNGFWPKKCFIKEFVQKSVVDLAQGNKLSNANFFQRPSHPANQT